MAESGIQKMLIQRLQRQVAALENEVKTLSGQKSELVDSLHRLANESMAKVYLLEEELSQARQQRDTAIERVEELERRVALAKARIRALETSVRMKDPDA